MATELQHIFSFLLAYAIGGIPTAFLIGKAWHGTDLRQVGSKNLGATNTFRVLGWKSGMVVLTIDILKGWLLVFFASSIFPPLAGAIIHLQLLVGGATVLGHILSPYMGFKGGKGVATVLGVVLAIHPWAALICLAIFLILFLLTRYVSLGSIIAALSFPILVILVFNAKEPALVHFSWIFALLILFTHRKNIDRLLRAKENKMRFSSLGEKEKPYEKGN